MLPVGLFSRTDLTFHHLFDLSKQKPDFTEGTRLHPIVDAGSIIIPVPLGTLCWAFFTATNTPNLTTLFDYALRMRDYIYDDLDNKKNKQNDPVWHGIIFPSHYNKSIIH